MVSQTYSGQVISDFRKAACVDGTYQLLFTHVSTGFPANNMNVLPIFMDFLKIRDDLVIEFGEVLNGSQLLTTSLFVSSCLSIAWLLQGFRSNEALGSSRCLVARYQQKYRKLCEKM